MRASVQARLTLVWSSAPKSVFMVDKRLDMAKKRPRNGLSAMRHHPPALFDYRWHVGRVGAACVACARGARGSTVAAIVLSTLIIAMFCANLRTIAVGTRTIAAVSTS
jgi:hypothetical protein